MSWGQLLSTDLKNYIWQLCATLKYTFFGSFVSSFFFTSFLFRYRNILRSNRALENGCNSTTLQSEGEETLSMHQITLEIVYFVKTNVQKCPIFLLPSNSWLSTINKLPPKRGTAQNEGGSEEKKDPSKLKKSLVVHFLEMLQQHPVLSNTFWPFIKHSRFLRNAINDDESWVKRFSLMNGCRFFWSYCKL